MRAVEAKEKAERLKRHNAAKIALRKQYQAMMKNLKVDKAFECVDKIAIKLAKVKAATNGNRLQLSLDVHSLVNAFKDLPKNLQTQIRNCKLSLNGAIKRCEAIHGKNNCQAVSSTMTSRRCAAGYVRLSPTTCALPCPAHFKRNGTFCMKPRSYTTPKASTKRRCIKAGKGEACEQFKLIYWTPLCKTGYARLGARECIPMCPHGWNDQGRYCERDDLVRTYTGFSWVNGEGQR